MSYYIVPYARIDGVPTFKDTQIMKIYDRIIEEGKGYVFQCGTIKNRQEFLDAMGDPSVFMYVVYRDTTIVLIYWLNRFEGALARVHICTFNDVSYKHKVEAGRYINKVISGCYDVLVAYIPKANRKAVLYSTHCGGKIAGTVPSLVWNEFKKTSEPGVIVYYRRDHEDL